MKPSDDNLSSQAPFQGDSRGDVFAEAELFSQSPMTTARIVEAQSGYTIVIKQADGKGDGRLSLSVKRRIGTPPASQLLLTGDESIRLSRLLDETARSLGSRGQYYLTGFAERQKQTRRDELAQGSDSEFPYPEESDYSAEGLSRIQQEPDYGDSIMNFDDGLPSSDINTEETIDYKEPLRKRRARARNNAKTASNATSSLSLDSIDSASARNSKRPALSRQALITVSAVAISGILLIGALLVLNFMKGDESSISTKAGADSANSAADSVQRSKVDSFARDYVANMLDFSPETYRRSQIQAMACMSGELLNKYWTETSFPISAARLRALPGGRTLMINEVKQEYLPENAVKVDIFADYSSEKSTKPDQVHLRLSLVFDAAGELTVVDQEDISSKKKG